jgi:outer membrane receptor protein involved in Fe transport
MKILYAALLGGASAIAISSAAYAQTQPDAADVEGVVVTGSRIVTNGNQAPTPVTVLATDQLLQTTPSNIPDALNRLPQFAAQTAQRNIQNAQSNATGSFLNLRRFGSNRNLVLLDGSRLPPTAASGAVDTNMIPQSLVQRVEVVTGGASAVYGSDAVTGVINFIIDKNFNGFKFDAQVGTSTYGDNNSWKIGGAVGTELFGGRGHIEASFDHFDSAGIINVENRNPDWVYSSVGGAGTAASPLRLYQNARLLTGSRGGMVMPIGGMTMPEGIRDMVFNANGVATPFVHGAPTGSNGLEDGGDGGYYSDGTLVAPLTTNQFFTRFDYDLTDSVSFNASASYNDARADYPYTAGRFTTRIFSGNPFLPAEFQRIMNGDPARGIAPTPYIDIGRLNHREDDHPARENDVFTDNVYFKTGFEGSVFGDWKWSTNYSFGQSRTTVWNRNNTYWPNLAAAADAVRDSTGKVVCAVSLTPYAGLYPGCVPLNVFGPTAPDKGAYEFINDDTKWTLKNKMHDVNFTIAGSPFSLPAGPVNVAINGEYRWLSLRNNSSVPDPTAAPNCTGLRPSTNCGSTMWQHDVTASMKAKQNVKEIAGEVLIPILADLPLIQSLEANLAGRYTDYNTSGSVETWKVGGNWRINDEIRLRATRSKDIRAPTLQDLYAPLALRPLGFNDSHTNTTRNINMYSQGNADLVPEVAKTTTVGVVYQPVWLPRFSVAVDYYKIDMNNAITVQAASNANVQRECLLSGGTSPFCALFERPLPFSDRSPANFPTKVYETRLNAAKQWTKGVDVEANYRFDLAEVYSSAPGSLGVRLLVGYQPTLKTQTISTAPATQQSGIAGMSKLRINLDFDYDVGPLSVNVSQRWQSKQKPTDPTLFVDERETIKAYSYTDMTVAYELEVAGHQVNPFLTVENLFNKKPPITGGGSNNTVPGLFFPSPQGFDVIGRYFTVGVRGRF